MKTTIEEKFAESVATCQSLIRTNERLIAANESLLAVNGTVLATNATLLKQVKALEAALSELLGVYDCTSACDEALSARLRGVL